MSVNIQEQKNMKYSITNDYKPKKCFLILLMDDGNNNNIISLFWNFQRPKDLLLNQLASIWEL